MKWHSRCTSVHELVELHLEWRVNITLATHSRIVCLCVSDERKFCDHLCPQVLRLSIVVVIDRAGLTGWVVCILDESKASKRP